MTSQRLLTTYAAAGLLLLAMAACSDDPKPEPTPEPDLNYVGKAVGNFTADEWYPGGRLGTTDNVTAGCYEDETPAVDEMGLADRFNLGETFFERNYTINTKPFFGLGPVSVRKSCLDCHPGYGHGRRQTHYTAGYGNGYLLAVYHPVGGPNSNDGPYITEITSSTQTQAVHPFLPPVDADKIHIEWKTVTAMESGLPMQFPDGERYELIYPEVTVPQSAFHTKPIPSNYAVRLESTLGIIGTGLLDAIPDDAIREQYRREAQSPHVELNPDMWDRAANDFAPTAYKVREGHRMVKRFNYSLSRASVQEDEAMWDIANISRPDRPYLNSTEAWAVAMSETPSVIAAIKANPTSPYYADGTDAGIARAVRTLLSPKTNQFKNDIHNFEVETNEDHYHAFMVWHRGLSIPRARNLNDKRVQRGKDVFMEIGCANCHRPQWKTGNDDNYYRPPILKGKQLPRYPNQTIYPYTDLVQHRLHMINDVHGSWCRTTPLWGRGLSQVNTGAEDRLHDCRARNEVEAIMWHAYSKQSDAYYAAEKFYKLPKEDRDAVVKFLRSI